MKDILPTLRGLNAWTLKQKILDHTIHKTPTIQLLQKIDVYSKDGELLRTTGEMKSHSFVLQFLQWMEQWIAHSYGVAPDYIAILDTTNTSRTVSATSNTTMLHHWAVEAPSTTTTYGIQVGTGVNAPATTDYALQTPVAHGSGAGQLQWGTCGVGAAGVVGANVDVVIARVFVNASGGSITLREIGLTATFNTGNNTSQLNFLLAHDSVNQAVADAEVAVVSYVMRTTV